MILFWTLRDTIVGSLILYIVNGFIMTIPIFIYHILRKKINTNSYYLFIFFWISYEYIRFKGDFAFPMLTLGNTLSNFPTIVQWYQ